MAFQFICDLWTGQSRLEWYIYRPQLHAEPYTILAWTAQSINLHMDLNAMFYLLNIIRQLVLVHVKSYSCTDYQPANQEQHLNMLQLSLKF